MQADKKAKQEELGRRLRLARKAALLNQEEAAKRIGIARPTLTQRETGRLGVDVFELLDMARVYGVSLAELLVEGCEKRLIHRMAFDCTFDGLPCQMVFYEVEEEDHVKEGNSL